MQTSHERDSEGTEADWVKCFQWWRGWQREQEHCDLKHRPLIVIHDVNMRENTWNARSVMNTKSQFEWTTERSWKHKNKCKMCSAKHENGLNQADWTLNYTVNVHICLSICCNCREQRMIFSPLIIRICSFCSALEWKTCIIQMCLSA